MVRLYFLKVILILSVIASIVSCSLKNSATLEVQSINAGDLTTDSPKSTEKEISTIKDNLNKDLNYVLLKDDQSLLASDDQPGVYVPLGMSVIFISQLA